MAEKFIPNQRIEVDWAEDSDNQKILELSSRCVQTGMIWMYPDRSPVFNRIHRLLDPHSYHAIARMGENVVGLLGTLHTDLYLGDTSIRTAYWLDFRVDPDYRNGLTAYRMVKPTIAREKEGGSRIALATLLKNNEGPLVFTKGRGGFPASLYLGDNRIFNIFPVKRFKINPAYTIDHPREEEIPGLVDLYNRFYSRYRLAPRITREVLEEYINNIDGLSLDNFWVARKDGRIRAVLAAWDEEPFKRYVILKTNLWIKVMRAVFRLMSLFTRMPATIPNKGPLTQLTLVLYAHDQDTAALGTLIRHVNNLNLGGRYSMIQIQIHQGDPANECLKGLTGVSVLNEIHVFTDTHQLARDIQNTPGVVHLEFPTYI